MGKHRLYRFTGRLVCEYLSKEYVGPSFRWAIAGRNKSKLEALRNEFGLPASVDTLQIDLEDSNSIDSVVSKSKVLLTTAGPYAKIGSSIVASCVRSGTHYCDITAEAPWIREMIDAHHEEALKKKLKIVNCCGFDCLPSDLGAQMMAEHLLGQGYPSVEEVRFNVLAMEGGLSGGTAASGMNIVESTPWSQLNNPYLLNPLDPVRKQPSVPPLASSTVQRAACDVLLPGYDSIAKIWTGPYIMQIIDLRVVNRSNALQGWRYGKAFLFSERFALPNLLTAVISSAVYIAVGLLILFKPCRDFLKTLLPKQGDGPSVQVRDSGFFKIGLWARARDATTGKAVYAKGSIVGMNGDPGYKQTAKMVAEAALCLALDADSLPASFGVITPAVAMGAALRKRLEDKGVHFSIKED